MKTRVVRKSSVRKDVRVRFSPEPPFFLFYLVVFLWLFGVSHCIALVTSPISEIYYFSKKNSDTYYVLSTEEEAQGAQVVYVDKIIKKKKHLQDKVWSKVFPSSEEAMRFIRSEEAKGFGGEMNINSSPLKPFSTGDDREFEPQQIITEVSSLNLWQARNEWNGEWENRFAKWIVEEINEDFFVNINLPSDCADLAYAARWIFSRIHQLPAAFHLVGTNDVFSNQSMKSEWKQLPTNKDWKLDRRFRASLEYLFDNTYTHTLQKDSYPIEISKEALIPGTIHLSLRGSSGHTQFVYRVNDPLSAPIDFYYSNLPKIVRKLSKSIFLNQKPMKDKIGGFLRFVWVHFSGGQVQFTKKEKMPYYSLDQYREDFAPPKTPYYVRVFQLLNPDFNFNQLVKAVVMNINSYFEERISIVVQGHSICQKNSCEEKSKNYEDWSTPSKDERQGNAINQLEFLLKFVAIPEDLNKEIIGKVFKIDNSEITFTQLVYIWKYNLFSSDPRKSIEERWGSSVPVRLSSFKKTLESLLKERKIFWQTHTKCSSCKIGSEDWYASSSLFIDEQLARTKKAIETDCIFFEYNSCEVYNSLLKEEVIMNKPISLWLEEIENMSSDPLHSEESRWGLVKKGITVDAQFSIYNSSDKKLFYGWKKGKPFIADLKTLKVLSVPPEEELGQFSPQANLYYTFTGGDQSGMIYIYNTDRQRISLLNLQLKSSEMKKFTLNWNESSDQPLLIYKEGSELVVYNLKGEVVRTFAIANDKIITQKNMNNLFYKSDNYEIVLLGKDSSLQVGLLNINTLEVTPTQIFPQAGVKNKYTILYVDEKFWSISASKDDSKEDQIYWNSSSGGTQELILNKESFPIVFRDHMIVQSNSLSEGIQSEIFYLNPGGKIKRIYNGNAFLSFVGRERILGIFNGLNNLNCYLVDEDNLEIIPLLKDEKSMLMCMDSLLLTKLDDQSNRLRKISGDILMEGPIDSIFWINGRYAELLSMKTILEKKITSYYVFDQTTRSFNSFFQNTSNSDEVFYFFYKSPSEGFLAIKNNYTPSLLEYLKPFSRLEAFWIPLPADP